MWGKGERPESQWCWLCVHFQICSKMSIIRLNMWESQFLMDKYHRRCWVAPTPSYMKTKANNYEGHKRCLSKCPLRKFYCVSCWKLIQTYLNPAKWFPRCLFRKRLVRREVLLRWFQTLVLQKKAFVVVKEKNLFGKTYPSQGENTSPDMFLLEGY